VTATAQPREEIGILDWMPSRLKIIDKAGALVPYVPNDEQCRLYGYAAAQEAAGLPVRILVLKARQIGISTATGALAFALTQNQENRKAFVCAHDDESSTVLFRMVKRFETELPAEERRPKDHSNRKEIIWSAPHRSEYRVQTAGAVKTSADGGQKTSTLGRSETIHYLHCSEVAFWPDPKHTLLALLQTVPDLPATAVILESTANGASGDFHDRWEAAVRHQREHPGDLSGYIPMFVSWLSAAEYRRPLAPGETLGALDEEEQRLRRLGADDEQLAWRRSAIADKCGGDPDLFKQEYPATPEDAFIVSGRPAIPPEVVAHHQKAVRAPARRVTLRRGPAAEVLAEDASDQAEYAWKVWVEPEEGVDYAVAGDVMEGQLSDRADVRSQPDWSTGVVLRRRDLAVVATFRARLTPDWHGEQLLLAAEWYNQAWASPEANAAGMAALAIFTRRSYGRLYQRQKGLDSLEAGQDVPLWGFKTTGANRDYLIDTYVAQARPDPRDGWAGKIQVWDQDFVDEERTFVWRGRRRQHQVGAHDDLLFAAFIALQIHLDCPRTQVAAAPVRVNPRLAGYRYVGGIDPGVGAEEDQNVLG
jgi:hypothetical protein